DHRCGGARAGGGPGWGRGDDRRGEAGAGAHPSAQLFRARAHDGAATAAPEQARRGAAVDELGDALGPGRAARRGAGAYGRTRAARSRRVVRVHEPSPAQRSDPGECYRRRRAAVDVAHRRTGHRPPAQGDLRLCHGGRRRPARRRPRGHPCPARALDGTV
ncbi:MAG: FIG00803858: hypothetical protein, partial [uncultured Rubrobacteraceae bacterium]